MATAVFYEKLHSLQNVAVEQEYIDIMLYSKPSIPDRTEFILGRSKENPLTALIKAAKTLEAAGATILVFPCMTSHYFYDDLVKEVRTRVVNFPEEVVEATKAKSLNRVGLLATEGAIKSKVLQNKFEAADIETVTPDIKAQAKLTELIYDIKRGKRPTSRLSAEITQGLIEKGVQTIVLGCTELCIDSSENVSAEGTIYINTLDILARATLRECNTL